MFVFVCGHQETNKWLKRFLPSPLARHKAILHANYTTNPKDLRMCVSEQRKEKFAHAIDSAPEACNNRFDVDYTTRVYILNKLTLRFTRLR